MNIKSFLTAMTLSLLTSYGLKLHCQDVFLTMESQPSTQVPETVRVQDVISVREIMSEDTTVIEPTSSYIEPMSSSTECMTSCMEIEECGTPLRECAFSIQVHAGPSPIIWVGRKDISLSGGPLPNYFEVFNLPFFIGGKVGFNVTDYFEAYVEGDYLQGSGRCSTWSVNCPSSTITATLATKLSKYSAGVFYIGSRYYFDCCRICRPLSFFAGLQVGVVTHRQTDIEITAASSVGTLVPQINPYFLQTTSISAGGNLGFDLCLSCNLSFVVTLEIIGNGAIRNYPVICLGTGLPGVNASTALVGRFQSEIWFPILFGLKYTF